MTPRQGDDQVREEVNPVFDARRRQKDAGFATVEWLGCVILSMLVLVMVMNLIAVQYGRGVLRAASDEGARAGARVANDQAAACLARETQVLSGTGKMFANITKECVVVNGQVRATTSATFAGWLPMVPNFHSTELAVSTAEKAPA